MNYVRAFAAGFLAVLVFHQGVLLVLHLLGVVPVMPWSFAPTKPFGVPQVISSSFWGGVWAVALWPALARASGPAYWVRAGVLGALGPTLVALLIVYPLKDRPFAAGWDPKIWTLGLIINGAWGLGYGWLARLLKRWF